MVNQELGNRRPQLASRSGAPESAASFLGYCDPKYAESLQEFGQPRELSLSGGWLLEREIAGTRYRDATGLYPLFQCRDWLALPLDLAHLRASGLVSATLVTEAFLKEVPRDIFGFFEVAMPFKAHYITDLEDPPSLSVSKHHRYYARRAGRELEWDCPAVPSDYVDEWWGLYQALVKRHQISGLRAFSLEAFRKLLTLPGVILLRARRQCRTVGAQIVVLKGDTAFAHLAAFTEEGYRLGASYLLDWVTIEYLRGTAAHINWGGAVGPSLDEPSGLARYKLGWASRTAMSFLLGAVLDREAYETLARQATGTRSGYFPSYRVGEFA